ncbi:SdpI family protein [Croceibacter atlanticus]|uniref:SdpI family protein n=2 Tax=Croceibacter atlanticus TaxID=313588 RepID=UPI0024BB1656|nr:SdpI family protein [Croceibacter atlanticus]
MDINHQLITGLSCAFILLILGIIFYKFPPKKINSVYGYRTPRSMTNQDTWDSANTFSSIWMIRFAVFTFLVSGASYVLIPEYSALITVIVLVLLVVLILPLTESHLKRHYTKSGSPKSVVDEFDLPPTGVTSSEEE